MLCYYQLQENACNWSDFFKFCRVKHGKSVQNKTNYSECHSPKMYNFQIYMFKSGFARKQKRRFGAQN